MATPGDMPAPEGTPAPTAEQLPELDVLEPSRQRRWTVLLRALLVVPHVIVLFALGIAALVVMIIGWFGALFTAWLPTWAASYLAGYLNYAIRVNAYLYFLVDTYPPFRLWDAEYPVRVTLAPDRLNRLAVLFRFILVIPAAIVSGVLNAGLALFGFFFWVAVLIAGRTPRPVFDAVAASQRYGMRLQAYWMMLTPAYPKKLFGDGPRVPDAPAPQPRYSDTRPLLVSSGAKTLLILMIVFGALAQVGGNVGYTAWTISSRLNGTDDQNGAIAALDNYYDSLVSGDGARACEFLSSDLQTSLSAQTGAPNCPIGIKAAQRQLTDPIKRNLANLRYDASKVQVTGDRATLAARDLAKANGAKDPGPGSGAIRFVRENGTWKLASLG